MLIFEKKSCQQQVYLKGRMFRKLLIGGSLLSAQMIFQKKEPSCCGIVGIVTKEPVPKPDPNAPLDTHRRYTLEEFLCEGVELLKNRGYDSAGIYTLAPQVENGSRLVKYADEGNKDISCINRVIEQVLTEGGVATSGIAHTRWATCGERVSRNAHPHYDQEHRIYLVHNGIIGNHAEIKNKYLSDAKFTSETDTEVIVQFLGLRRRQGKTILQALTEFASIAADKSQWGLVIIDKDAPDTIYTFTNGSPLLIGFSEQEDQIYVVSEQIAFQKHADCFFDTKDNQLFELKVSEIPALKEKLKSRLRKVDKSVEINLIPPPPFKYFYNYEIRQQVTIPFVPNFDRVKAVQFGNYLSIIACGSSYYAASASEYFFKKLRCFKKMHIIDPVELDHNDITEDETVLLISQSGETKDLIQIVGDCQKKEKVNTIGIINVEGSTLARKVDFPIYIKVGREVCVAATKSFFHQVLNIIQFATEVAEKKKSAPIEEILQIREELLQVPSKVQEAIDRNQQKCIELAELLEDRKSIFLLGKRESLAIAREAALKIKQLNYIHAQALGACEMKHGPIALIDSESKDRRETVVFLFIFNNDTYSVMMNALDQMHSRNAFVVVITDCEDLIEQNYKKSLEKNPQAEKKYHFVLNVPYLKHASHLLSIVPIQLFVEKMSLLKKIDPVHPRNLAKSVTV